MISQTEQKNEAKLMDANYNKQQVLFSNDFKVHTIKPILMVKYHIILAVVIYLILSAVFIEAFLPITIVFFLAFSAFLRVKIREYNATEFVIDKEKVSYIRNWIDYNRTDIRYENIKEVVVKQSVLKKLFNLGDVSLISNISSNNAGITFFNIENPLQIYSLLQERINSSQLSRS